MSVDHIRYDILTQEALRGLVRTVLADAAAKGLPGDHHFFILFDTTAPGVRISSRLKERYPKEMTIVLQHQFWDLVVGDDSFSVGLSFNGVSERLTVPFATIKGFADPSVLFELQFAAPSAEGTVDAATDGTATPPAAPQVPRSPAAPDGNNVEPPPREPAEGGAVVRLDQFRKKK